MKYTNLFTWLMSINEHLFIKLFADVFIFE